MDKYSRWIRFLTIALPIFSLALIVLVFFVDWTNSDEVTSQFSDEDRAFNEEVQAQSESPSFSSKTNEGDEILINAQSLQQDAATPDRVIGSDVEGDVQVGGSQWEIESTEGETDSQGRVAEFRGQVMALIDGEYNLLGTQLVADVAERTFTSEFPIDVKSERFDLAADSASMSGVRGERLIELDGNVKGVIRLGDYTNERDDEDGDEDNETTTETDSETAKEEAQGNDG